MRDGKLDMAPGVREHGLIDADGRDLGRNEKASFLVEPTMQIVTTR